MTFIGHGVGVELVEPPYIAKGRKDRLAPGMTIALEPKMVFENQFSAGIESMFVVTETGVVVLSEVPVDIFIRWSTTRNAVRDPLFLEIICFVSIFFLTSVNKFR